MADTIALTLPKFNKAEFISLAESNEGYLFPDTYRILKNQPMKAYTKTGSKRINAVVLSFTGLTIRIIIH